MGRRTWTTNATVWSFLAAELLISGRGLAIQKGYVSFSEGTTSVFVNLMTASSSNVTGAIKNPFSNTYNCVDGPSLPPVGDVGGSCGVTFVSKHYALTAAHCVDHLSYFDDPFPTSFTVERIKTNTLVVQAAIDAATVNGTWANWQIPDPMTAADGYIKTSFQCYVSRRCDITYGPRFCPFSSSEVDIAAIYCPGRPTPQDWVPVSATDPGSQVAIDVYWPHEILALQRTAGDSAYPSPTTNFDNYGYYKDTTCKEANFHYTAVMTNQLLPLRSRHWADGTNYLHKYNVTGAEAMTTTPICHGTSGSGVFLNGSSGLLGPMSTSDAIGDRLCQDMAGASHTGDNSRYIQRFWAKQLEVLYTGDR